MAAPPPGPSPLVPLRLSDEQVATAADFHESYARTVLAEARSAGGPSTEALIEAASAYRLAGQWRLLVAPDRAVRETLAQAADLFTEAGLAYGAYLRASLAPREVERSTRDSWTRQLLLHGTPRNTDDAVRRETDALLDHPQQQTYLLLACAMTADEDPAARDRLTAFATTSPHRVGVVPVGSLAMPVRMFWGLALNLLDEDSGHAAASYAATLSELSRAYARSVELAMANKLTWSKAAAPVDVADLDVIGAVAMGVRRFGEVRMRRLLADVAGELSAVAEVPLNIGIRVAGPPGPEPPEPQVPPTSGPPTPGVR
ncbi:hypothetical protein ACFYQT_14305 [Streptomyces tibetensis]|uniref:Uncharacterized protein n=1 Tax=Streptomyces tibetensis TaxID=2382123 RepID=A0ABW6MUB3_9ACTN